MSQVAPGSTGGAFLDDPGAMRVSATAAPETAPADWTLHAYGVCAYRLQGVEYQREYLSAYREGEDALSARADCSPGKNLVGVGGQSFAIPGQVRLSTVFPRTDDAVAATVTPQPDPTASWAVQAIAVCADHEAERVLDSTGFGDRSVEHTTAQCPSGKHPTGGGYLHAGDPGNLVQSLLIPMSDRVVGTTRTDTRTTPGDWLAAAYALCLPATRLD